MDFNVNLIAVIVAAVVHQVLGFLWYGPLFGETWLRAVGTRREELGSPGPAIAVGAVGSLLAALALALVLTLSDDPTLGEGIAVGAVAGIGFAATTMFTAGAYEKRSATGSALFSAYQVLGFLVMGAILGAWQ